MVWQSQRQGFYFENTSLPIDTVLFDQCSCIRLRKWVHASIADGFCCGPAWFICYFTFDCDHIRKKEKQKNEKLQEKSQFIMG
jgi:7-keto-8-aminopelargonate synthetase-like enzyme